jgi:hypothetical protein
MQVQALPEPTVVVVVVLGQQVLLIMEEQVQQTPLQVHL